MNNRDLKNLLKLSIGCFLLSFTVQVFVSNIFAVRNITYQTDLARLSDLNRVISRLRYDDLVLSSLLRVEQEALALGYVPLASSPRIITSPRLASVQVR